MRKCWIPIVFAVVLVVIASGIMIGYPFFAGSGQDMDKPWMFKGAYATYVGQVDSVSFPLSLNATIDVTDLNVTHVQVRTRSTIAPSFAPAVSDQTIIWINKTSINFQPPGETLAGTYHTQIALEGIGTRTCTVYDYINEAINATYYIDVAFQWPLRIVYVTTFENQPYTMVFNLNVTNISVLT